MERMAEDSGDRVDHETAPDLERARAVSQVAHGVVVKLKEMGLPHSLDADLAGLSTDLGDLWGAHRALAERMDALLSASHDDWGCVGDQLVDIRTSIDHIAWHLKSVRRPLTRITQFAYKLSQGSA